MLKNSVQLTLWIFKLRNLEKYQHLNLSAVNMYAKLRNQVFFVIFLFVCFVLDKENIFSSDTLHVLSNSM